MDKLTYEDRPELNPHNLPVGDGTYVIDPDGESGKLRKLDNGLYAVDGVVRAEGSTRFATEMLHESDAKELDDLIDVMAYNGVRIVTQEEAENATPEPFDPIAAMLRQLLVG